MALSTELFKEISNFKDLADKLPNDFYISKKRFWFLNKFLSKFFANRNVDYDISLSKQSRKMINEIKGLANRLPDSDNLSKLFLSYIIEKLPNKEGDIIDISINEGTIKKAYQIKFGKLEKGDDTSNLTIDEVQKIWKDDMMAAMTHYNTLIDFLSDEESAKIKTLAVSKEERAFFEKYGFVFLTVKGHHTYSAGGFPFKISVT